MLKILVKKQLLEINRCLFVSGKTGERRNKKAVFFAIAGFTALMLFLAVAFFFLFSSFVSPLAQAGLNWLYFALTGGFAIFIGAFGSVFNTFSTLYLSKDNDFLLSLPLPPKSILASRLISVYILGAAYSVIVSVPACVAYYVFASPTAAEVFASLFSCALITLVVAILSCLLGYVVAKISVKLKNKSLITVIISLVVIGVYYFVYFKMNDAITSLIENGEAVAAAIKVYAYPVYSFGKACVGSPLYLLCVTAVICALCVAIFAALSHSFIKIITNVSSGGANVRKKRKIKVRTSFGTLLHKELKRFVSSASYMLNSGMGTALACAAAIAAIIKNQDIYRLFNSPEIGYGEYALPIVAAVAMLSSSINTLTASSVSLEGKNLWILRSLPVKPVTIILAKLALHLIVTLPALEFLTITLSVVTGLGATDTICVICLTAFAVVFAAEFGLLLNLKMPNFKWTNETVAVKQGMPVFLSLTSGMVLTAVLGGAYFAIRKFVSVTAFVWACAALSAIAAFILFRLLVTKGVKLFDKL